MPRNRPLRRSPRERRQPRAEHPSAQLGVEGYTTREVADVVGLPTSKILAWTRAGLLTPVKQSGAYHFSFQDIALLRRAKELLDEAVPARRVEKALVALRDQMPMGRPLSAVDLSAGGDAVLVRDADTLFEPDSGQIQLDFAAPASGVDRPLVIGRVVEPPSNDGEMNADDWFNTGVDLESISSPDAMDAYGRALELEPEHPDALLNLGRLQHEAGNLDAAERRYRAAVFADPFSARALYNLGVLLEDQDQPRDAEKAYLEALRIDRDLASAHFNLARLHRASKRRKDALRHIKEYKRIVERRDVDG